MLYLLMAYTIKHCSGKASLCIHNASKEWAIWREKLTIPQVSTSAVPASDLSKICGKVEAARDLLL